MPKIFISYRRDDTSGYAGRLAETLRAKFGRQNVFMDIASIDPGDDFLAAIRREMTQASVCLVLIGKRWLAAEADGTRRINDPGDVARGEAELALTLGLRVIPTLVNGAAMPTAADLPASLAPLLTRNAFLLDDRHWDNDVAKLAHTLAPRFSARAVVRPAVTAAVLVAVAIGWLAVSRAPHTKPRTTSDPRITSVSVVPVTNDAPSNALRLRIVKDQYLNEFIWKTAALSHSKAAAEWLNGYGGWNRECATVFGEVVTELTNKIAKGTTLRWNPQERDEPETYIIDPGQNRVTLGDKVIQEATSLKTGTRYRRVTYYADTWPADTVLAILRALSSELERTRHPIRTGDVALRVEVLNPSDSDLVIQHEAVVKTGAGSVAVRAEKAVDVGPHSLAEMTFATEALGPGQGASSASAALAEAVRSGRPVPIELIVTVGGKPLSAAATTPPLQP